MQTGWPCGGLSQNCPATLCAVSLAPSPAFRPTLKRRAYSAKPLRGSETARRPRPRGPSARGGFAQSARWFTIGLNRMPPTKLGHPPPSGRLDKSPLSEYTLSAPFQVTIQASSPPPRRLRRQRRSRWGRGEAKQLPFQNKNALRGDHSTDRGPVSTPARAARRLPVVYHKRRLPSSPGGAAFLFPVSCPKGAPMDSNSRDPGSLRNFSVLLLPHPRVFSRLPTTRPLSSLGEAHRLLRTPEKSSGLRAARPPRWRTWVNSL